MYLTAAIQWTTTASRNLLTKYLNALKTHQSENFQLAVGESASSASDSRKLVNPLVEAVRKREG